MLMQRIVSYHTILMYCIFTYVLSKVGELRSKTHAAGLTPADQGACGALSDLLDKSIDVHPLVHRYCPVGELTTFVHTLKLLIKC